MIRATFELLSKKTKFEVPSLKKSMHPAMSSDV